MTNFYPYPGLNTRLVPTEPPRNNWRVIREFNHLIGRYEWSVQRYHPGFLIQPGQFWGARSFDTHAEAIAYADKQARTIEVTLPPARGEGYDYIGPPTQDEPLRIDSWGINSIRLSQAGEKFLVIPDQIKPLALALLAHHYRQESQ